MKTYCGIDLGTQSCKILLYDPESRSVVAESRSKLDLTSGEDGTREQNAGWYESSVRQCFSAIEPKMRATIAGIGVSGQQHGFVPLDENGAALRPVKLWCDTSTSEECSRLTEDFGGKDALLSELGMLMLPGYTAPKILWMKNREPELFARLRRVLLPHDYVNFLLTGTFSAEFGDASGTALFDIRSRKWSTKACGLIDGNLERYMPRLVEAHQKAGIVSPEASVRYGIPEGVPVAAGGGDNMMSAIGTGTVRDGFLTMSLGTSGTLFGYSAVPVVDPDGSLAAFCSSTGGWLPLLCTMNCTVATEEFRALFGLGIGEFEALAAGAPPGAEGIVILPFFNGERVPNLPFGRASVCGATAANFSRANIARAAYESAIFGMRIGLDSFRRLGFAAREIRLAGGGATSPLWRSMVANITGLPVRIPAGTEAAAMGAAIQAMWCVERPHNPGLRIEDLVDAHVRLEPGQDLEPDPAEMARYDRAYGEYSKYLAALSPLFR